MITPYRINLIIVDKQMEKATSSKTIHNLLTKGSHTKNLTIMYILQNMYNAGSSKPTVSLNNYYNVVFKNTQDASQFNFLASQIQPGDFY